MGAAEQFFIGIDLGWKDKKTTEVCILKSDKIYLRKDVFGKYALRTIEPYLGKTGAIAVDAPLTEGKGKGRMRLFEKFLSTSVFRKEKINPVPPALLVKLRESADNLTSGLNKYGFVLGVNLIETSTRFVKKVAGKDFIAKNSGSEREDLSAMCAKISLLHHRLQTRYLGYKDGFLFLPEILFWKKEWQEKFYRAWTEKDHLRYRRLITDLF